MAGLGDYRYRQDGSASAPEPPESDGRSTALIWTVAAVAALALGAVLYFYFRPTTPAPQTSETAPEAVAETTEEVAPWPKTLEPLPPLDGSDALVRQLIKELSSRPELVTWLANDDLIRAFVGIVSNIDQGESPKSFLADFMPDDPFRVTGAGTRFSTDARSFARYDRAADAFTSLDAAGVAGAYQRLEPLLEAGYRELGMEGTFRGALERAIGRLLAAPDVPSDAPLTWNFATYQYADARLESLPAAEKQFLRMGPRNVRIVKEKLRELTRAMGLTPRQAK